MMSVSLSDRSSPRAREPNRAACATPRARNAASFSRNRPMMASRSIILSITQMARFRSPRDALHALGRRILEVQRLAGVHDRVHGVGCDRCFGEALEDQLELAGIGRDVADGEHAGQAGL